MRKKFPKINLNKKKKWKFAFLIFLEIKCGSDFSVYCVVVAGGGGMKWNE